MSSYELNTLRYATLTDLAAADFATEPGLAESWSSEDGKTYTYTLRDGLQWSDGTATDGGGRRLLDQPLPRRGVAELHLDDRRTSRREVRDERTVVVTSSVNDPKLPSLTAYILPKHVYEKVPADEIGTYTALDDVASGPFQLTEWKKGQFWRMEANPNFWRGPGRDRRGRLPRLPQRGRDGRGSPQRRDRRRAQRAGGDVPRARDQPRASSPSRASRAAFDYLVLNSYAGKPPRDESKFDEPHPALLDPQFRQAIAPRDQQGDARRARVLGHRPPRDDDEPERESRAGSRSCPWRTQYEFDLEKSKQILDDAGYTDSDGNGIREYEGEDIVLRYAIRSESAVLEAVLGVHHRAGSRTSASTRRSRRTTTEQLIEVAGKGDFDLYVWGWVPFVDPDPMLSYFQCSQVSRRRVGLLQLLQRHRRSATRRTTRSYEQQNTELDKAKRESIVHDMLTRFYKSAGYIVPEHDSRPPGVSDGSVHRMGPAAGRHRARCCSRTRRRPTGT